eukprot:3390892-Rhodomonas_salina.1
MHSEISAYAMHSTKMQYVVLRQRVWSYDRRYRPLRCVVLRARMGVGSRVSAYAMPGTERVYGARVAYGRGAASGGWRAVKVHRS